MTECKGNGIFLSLKLSLLLKFIVFINSIIICKSNDLQNGLLERNYTTEWTVLSGIEHLRNKSTERDYFLEEHVNLTSLLSEKSRDSLLSGIFSSAEKKNKAVNSFLHLENLREDFLKNWAFNIKYGSERVANEARLDMLLYFVKQKKNTKKIKFLNEEDGRRLIPNTHRECWESYLKLVREYKYEFYNRDFETEEEKNEEISDLMSYYSNENSKEFNCDNTNENETGGWNRNMKSLAKRGLGIFQYNKEIIDSFGLNNVMKLIEPVKMNQNHLSTIKNNLVRSFGEEDDKNFNDKKLDKEKFLLRYTCELYMICREKVDKMIKEEYEDYDFHKTPIEGRIYRTWKELYRRSPSESLWYLFKRLIEIRGDLTVFNLSNGDMPLLPTESRLKLPESPPIFFEFTILPKVCSNNLLALSMNNGYRIRLGVKKIPKYIHYGKLYRYFESSLTSSYTSLNLCMRGIKLLTMYQAHYYKSINEYKPNPDSSFYWQTLNWETLGGYVSYLPTNEKSLYPGRNQFVWCLMWSCTEYTRTFSHYRINPIKVRVKDVMHLPMRMQTLGMKPTVESCMILLRFFWAAKLIKVNQRKYRPLELDSNSDVLFDYSSLYYVCVTILRCRVTYHRAYLKQFYPDEINNKIEKLYDTQDPQNVYNNLNDRFILINTPKIKSLKKIKTLFMVIAGTVLFSAMSGIMILNIITGINIRNNLFRMGFNNPLRDLMNSDGINSQ
ncbi:hypothetical protein FG386_002756 [Cryptosporidium ryanae]|uniref:uncharacterized protein n=1 Tax=Cryptosporidium ryanae TaxID=515981 RepID=UPI00351AA865|nr:hypothetical protein FG386_002756 [Cryptosporidium ryanae]